MEKLFVLQMFIWKFLMGRKKMIRRIDHISIGVWDLDKARKFFIDGLGGRELFCAPVPEQKYRWTTIELGTSCFIELIDPLEKEGFLYRFLEKRGEGPHHLTVPVDDINQTYRTLEEKGIPTFGLGEPFPGWKEMYIHPKHAFGTLIQFAEFNPLDWISQGYIPAAYKEFAPKEAQANEEIKVLKGGTEGEFEIEIRQGEDVIRLNRRQLANLKKSLQELGGD